MEQDTDAGTEGATEVGVGEKGGGMRLREQSGRIGYQTPLVFDCDLFWDRVEQEIVNRATNMAAVSRELGFSKSHFHNIINRRTIPSAETFARILIWIGDLNIKPYLKVQP